MPIRELKAQIARLPEQPGVYLYSNGAGETLYVGKARVLRDRVRSYLGAHGMSPRIDALLDEAQRLEVIVTDSVMEALALENHLIKQRAPKYNILLRDDKNYPVPAADDRGSVSARPGRAAGRTRQPLLRRPVPAGLARPQDDVADAPAVRDPVLQRDDYRRARPAVPRIRHQALRGAVRPRALQRGGVQDRGRAHAALSRRAQRRTADGPARADDRSVGRGAVRAGRAAARRHPHDRDAADAAAEDGRASSSAIATRSASSSVPPARSCRSSRSAAAGSSSASSWSPTIATAPVASRSADAKQKSCRPRCSSSTRIGTPPPEVHLPIGLPAAGREMLEGWLSAQAERRVRLVAPKRGEKRGLLDLAARNAEVAYQARFNENVAANYDALETLRAVLALPAVAATDRVLRHLHDPGQRDRRVDGRLRRRPDEEVGVPEVQDRGPATGGSRPKVSF